MNTVSPSTVVASQPSSGGAPRYVWALVATAAVAITALAGAMTWKTLRGDAGAEATPAAAAAAPALTASQVLADSGFLAPNDVAPAAPADEVAPPPKAQPKPKPQPKPAPVAQHRDPAPAPAPVAQANTGSGDMRPAPSVPICTSCGVIESVQAVQHKGEGSGLGAVAGGVVGGLLGNQVGGGNGRKVATVIGAVGGGVAGHEIEKRARAETVYNVKVRMDDGSTRSITQATAPTVGQRVTVDGNSIRASSAPMPGATGDSGARTWQTGGRS